MQVIKAAKKEIYKSGVKLTARSYGCVRHSSNGQSEKRRYSTSSMRHTSLQTTTKYMRLVKDRLQNALKFLVNPERKKLEADFWRQAWSEICQKTRNDILTKLAIEALKRRSTKEMLVAVVGVEPTTPRI